VFVTTPEGYNILYDCGTRHPFFDPGAYTVGPALLQRGVRRIDLLVCSHSDIDHVSGVPAILERFDVRMAVCPAALMETGHDTMARGLMDWFQKYDVPVHPVVAGEMIGGLGRAVVKVLHPLPPPMTISRESPNETSVVLSIRTSDGTVLLTGDIEERGIAAVLRSDEAQADVIVMPHHGQPVGNIVALLDHVKPNVALLSAPVYMRSEKVMTQLEKAGIKVAATWDYGCIDVCMGEKLRIEGTLKR